MRAKLLVLVVLAAVVVLAASAVSAAVTFDAESGVGFVGKGDVQDAFGWNNKGLQDKAANVTFSYEETGTFTFVCSRQHSQHGTQYHTFPNKSIDVLSEVEYELRNNKQGNITGFLLDGFGDEEVTGEGCPSGWPDEVSRTPNEGAGSVVGLFAHNGEQSVQIWPTE
jgi:hypothetical protein